jgi:hypothetical protein
MTTILEKAKWKDRSSVNDTVRFLIVQFGSTADKMADPNESFEFIQKLRLPNAYPGHFNTSSNCFLLLVIFQFDLHLELSRAQLFKRNVVTNVALIYLGVKSFSLGIISKLIDAPR